MPQLQTERLLLREWRESDLDEWARMYADPEVTRYIGGPIDRIEAWSRLTMQAGQWALRGYGMWAVESRADGALLGRTGLWRPEGWPGLEIGWAFVRSAWGQGFATEAARAAVAWTWENVATDRLISLIHPDNAASIRLARRLGMAPVGEQMIQDHRAIVFGLDRRLEFAQPG